MQVRRFRSVSVKCMGQGAFHRRGTNTRICRFDESYLGNARKLRDERGKGYSHTVLGLPALPIVEDPTDCGASHSPPHTFRARA